MVKLEKLKAKIAESGMTMTAIANKSGMLRATLYHRLNGSGEFTASEIIGMTRALKLTRADRDDIFLS